MGASMVVLAATPAERHPQPANSNLGSPSISTAMLAGHMAGKQQQYQPMQPHHSASNDTPTDRTIGEESTATSKHQVPQMLTQTC